MEGHLLFLVDSIMECRHVINLFLTMTAPIVFWNTYHVSTTVKTIHMLEVITADINPLSAKLFNLNFYPLEVVFR